MSRHGLIRVEVSTRVGAFIRGFNWLLLCAALLEGCCQLGIRLGAYIRGLSRFQQGCFATGRTASSLVAVQIQKQRAGPWRDLDEL